MRRILFEIPLPFFQKHIPIYAYGFMLMVAFLVSIAVARWRARKEGVDPSKVADVGIYLVCAGIVGARIFFVIQFFDDYKNNLFGIFKVYEGGLVYYGGLFTGALTLFVYVRKHRLPVLKLFDIVAPSIALGLGIGRIGCFLNGCCFGKLAPHIPWAVRFPRTIDKAGMIDGSPAFLHHYELGLVRLADSHALPIHPTQLYSFLADAVLFFLLNAFFKYRKKNGEVLLLLGILYPIIRYSMELLRNDTPLFFSLFTIAQIISISVFIISTTLFVVVRWRGAKNNPAT